MIKEDPYQLKFEKLQPWASAIFQAVKKELRNEHLLRTPSFAQKHFAKRPIDKLSAEEYAVAYLQEISEGNEEIGEKVATHWILKHTDLYQLFVSELSKINPKYDEIQSLSPEFSAHLLNNAVTHFTAAATYIFCILNAVVLTSDQLIRLREMALAELQSQKQEEEKRVFTSIEALKEHYEREARKLVEKHEKKIQGLERKYLQDVDGLKKQIAQLHKKLGEQALARAG